MTTAMKTEEVKIQVPVFEGFEYVGFRQAQTGEYIVNPENIQIPEQWDCTGSTEAFYFIYRRLPERKFKVGDWIQPGTEGGLCTQVEAITRRHYDVRYRTYTGSVLFEQEKDFHLVPPRPTDEQCKAKNVNIIACRRPRKGDLYMETTGAICRCADAITVDPRLCGGYRWILEDCKPAPEVQCNRCGWSGAIKELARVVCTDVCPICRSRFIDNPDTRKQVQQ